MAAIGAMGSPQRTSTNVDRIVTILGMKCMASHSKAKIQKLQDALQERLDRLLKAMRGTDIGSEEQRMHGLPGPHASVRSDDVRIAVDDFQTILKEIKASLGKR